jgi:hypothetical protein
LTTSGTARSGRPASAPSAEARTTAIADESGRERAGGSDASCSSLADVHWRRGGDDRIHAIASVMIDRVGGEYLPPPRDVRDARFDRVRARVDRSRPGVDWHCRSCGEIIE